MSSRRLLRRNHAAISSMIDAEANCYKELMSSPEAREAFTAFLEKRPPDFAKLRKAR
jgi:enoyl-CoA hydratase/carnithine racemase